MCAVSPFRGVTGWALGHSQLYSHLQPPVSAFFLHPNLNLQPALTAVCHTQLQTFCCGREADPDLQQFRALTVPFKVFTKH